MDGVGIGIPRERLMCVYPKSACFKPQNGVFRWNSPQNGPGAHHRCHGHNPVYLTEDGCGMNRKSKRRLRIGLILLLVLTAWQFIARISDASQHIPVRGQACRGEGCADISRHEQCGTEIIGRLVELPARLRWDWECRPSARGLSGRSPSDCCRVCMAESALPLG